MVLIFAFAFLGMSRVASLVTNGDNKYLSNTVSVVLESGRGDFYYSDGKKITSSKRQYKNIFLPTDVAKEKFYSLAKKEEKIIGEKAFANNKPAVLIRNDKIIGTGIYSFEVSDRYGAVNSLEHIIGYVNGENAGVTGLEKSYENVLKSNQNVNANFFVDAKGGYLAGVYPNIEGEKIYNKVFLTVDSKIQTICSNAMDSTERGAAIVCEISNGKIRGMVSKPDYDLNNISKYLSNADSPFLNRALSCYNVGSVFKPLIAAGLCENNKQDFLCTCNGFTEISGIKFHCYNRNGHGKMGMKDALRDSCNCYFYNAVRQISPNKITSLATSLMLDIPIKIGENLISTKGILPKAEEIENPATAANFSIGQGKVLLSPLSVTNLYMAIANDGVYYRPKIVEAIYKDGKYQREEEKYKTTVMSKSTAAQLKEYLSYVVSFGTGKAAAPEKGGAAGKTATAQTGKYIDKTEIDNSWFCGFFPLDKPKYAVTVFLENSNSQGVTATEIFKEIADNINSLND
jgi:penicillin-binding protein 2